MTQVIFWNTETDVQHLYKPGFMFRHLPRVGEEVALYNNANDEAILDGIVESVRWSVGDMQSEDDYSIFISVKPFRLTPLQADAAGSGQNEGQAIPAAPLKPGR